MSTLPPPGWYPDETQHQTLRYWNGTAWTEQRAPMMFAQATPQPMPTHPKRMGLAYAQLILLGGLALHRFYLRRVGSACGMLALTLAYFLLLALFGTEFGDAGLGRLILFAIFVWEVVDAFLIPRMTREVNRKIWETEQA